MLQTKMTETRRASPMKRRSDAPRQGVNCDRQRAVLPRIVG
jgi:hypothetical protein